MTWRDAANNEAAKKTQETLEVYYTGNIIVETILAEIAAHDSIASPSFSLSGLSVFYLCAQEQPSN